MRTAELAGRCVAVWGIGAEGRAAAVTARRAGAGDIVAVVDGDPPAPVVAAWSGAGLADVPVVTRGDRAGTAALGRADVVVMSPGVSLYRDEVRTLVAGGVSVTSGTQLFLAEHGGRTVAVTGSKGKSTVTRLAAQLLSAAGQEVVAAGNVGAPLLDLLPDPPALVVAEVSSYQAALVTSPPRIAVLTALFPDHLPWHGGVARYYRDKLRVVAGAAAVLVNGADPGVRERLADRDAALAAAIVFGTPDATVRVAGDVVMVGDRPVLPLRRSRLPGAHNALNVAGAVAVLDALGIDVVRLSGRLEDALARFAPLPHRLEPVAVVRDVTFVDDSLATSAQAAVAACEAYPGRPLTLLAGGLDRGIDYEPLVRYLHGRVARTPVVLVAMGEAGRRLAAGVAAAAPGIASDVADDVGDGVRLAAARTPCGGVVLFSPAAPSPPEYGSYERRSAAFVAAVRGLTQ